jgi:hypothetical protein
MEKTAIFLVFQFSQNKIWAFKEMGRPLYKVPDIKGLQFFKMLGTGRNGFSIWPNWGTYAALLVFDSGDFHIENSAWYTRMQAKSSSVLKVILSPVKSHGLWNRSNPFVPSNTPRNQGGPVAVITRASVKPSQWWRFWWFVPQVSKTIPKDCLFSIGIGELPLIEQATLSIWPSVKAMTDWAYKLGNHQKAIQNTHNYQWYSEEMFTRFEILGVEGSYKDINGKILWDSLIKG